MSELCQLCPYKDTNKCGIEAEQVGQGTPQLIFVGESPANEERENGRPFVGMFGGLLRQMIRAYNTDKVPYLLANITACVPDDRYESNRALAICRYRFWDLLKIYPDAKLIALGSYPTQMLAGVRKITDVDGTWVHHDGRDVLCLSIAFINNIFAFPAFELGFKRAFTPVEYPMIPNVLYSIPRADQVQRWFENDWTLQGDIALDIETTGFDFTKDRFLCVGIGWDSRIKPGEPQVLILSTEHNSMETIGQALRALWKNPNVRLGTHNGGNFDLPWLMHTFGLPYRMDWDTLLMHYSIQEGGVGTFNSDWRDNASRGHGLKILARRYLNVANYNEGVTFNPQTQHDWDELHKYLAIDVWNTLQLKKLFDQKIQEGV